MSAPDLAWLRANAGERMDANLAIFPEDRRAFHIARYRFAAERVAGLRVADIACGTGYGTAMLSASASMVVGVDCDPQAIAYAETTYPDNARFLCREACDTGLPGGSFDAVVSFETLEHVPDDSAAVAEFARLLSPRGRLIVSVPNLWGLTRYHVRDYSLASITAVLSTMFHVKHVWSQNSGTPCKTNRAQPAGITPVSDTAECFIIEAVKK